MKIAPLQVPPDPVGNENQNDQQPLSHYTLPVTSPLEKLIVTFASTTSKMTRGGLLKVGYGMILNDME